MDCAANLVTRCYVQGQHRPDCTDDDCPGCLPTQATVGALCEWCYGDLQREHERYREWRAEMVAAGWKPAASSGGGSTPLGYSPLPPAWLAADAADRAWAGMAGRTLAEWVAVPFDALQARRAAGTARRARLTFPTRERKPVLERVRCDHCGLPTVGANPTEDHGPHVVVRCVHCGGEIARVLRPGPRWSGSRECEAGRHDRCESVLCECEHHLS